MKSMQYHVKYLLEFSGVDKNCTEKNKTSFIEQELDSFMETVVEITGGIIGETGKMKFKKKRLIFKAIA